MTQINARTVAAVDQKTLWLNDEIWPEVYTLIKDDAYFQLWLKANEIAATPYGPIAQTIINSYAISQLASLRRLCDLRPQDDVISLPKILKLIGHEQPHRKAAVDSLAARLKQDCAETYALATQYVAHNGNPAGRNWLGWSLTSAKLMKAQQAVCEVTVIVERDLLAITQHTHILPVPQFDYLAELKAIVPAEKLNELRDFWHAHNATVNAWVQVQRLV